MTLDIMMPFYGRFDHLREAVEGVLAQSDPDWRLVVVDDAYPDPEPGAWVRAIDDRRVEYVRNESNLGVAGSFNRCVELARTERLVITGCDDAMLPGFVALLQRLARAHPDAAMIQPGVAVMDDDGRPSLPLGDFAKQRIYRPRFRDKTAMRGEALAVSIVRGNWLYFPSMLWRRDAVLMHRFDASWNVVMDLCLEIELALDGAELVVAEPVVFRYRRHRTSVSSSMADDGSRFREEARFFEHYERRFTDAGWPRAAGAARRRLSSRANALVRLPAAISSGDRELTRELARHVGGRSR